jgi:hypothetical protein
MFPTVDLLNVEVLEVLARIDPGIGGNRSGTCRELVIPRRWICDDLSVKKGSIGPLSVWDEWARKEGLLLAARSSKRRRNGKRLCQFTENILAALDVCSRCRAYLVWTLGAASS